MKNKRSINREIFRDKVHGCWLGKAAGGTLGAPYEWSKDMNCVSFYPPEINGTSIPNDDLDLQLVWLAAVERFGAVNINERILAEYWSEMITGPWNEYGICRNNIRMGLYPPLSGSCGNDIWKWSNGAWIRSEIWACLFPGAPEEAAMAAYADACCDHCGEGIYAEIFTAAMESAAFVESDIHKLIGIGLSLIPSDSRIASVIQTAIKCHKEGYTLPDARNTVLKEVEDLGYFQAPGNIAFAILGLLYGNGDFGKSIAYAVNCGDDADCSGGFAGSVIGIILGKSNIPEEWLKPIGDTIVTCSIENTGRLCIKPIPKTITELTDRVIICAEIAALSRRNAVQFTEEESCFLPEELLTEKRKRSFRNFLGVKREYELSIDLPWGIISFEYENGPFIESGKECSIKVRIKPRHSELPLITVRPRMPEGWKSSREEMILTSGTDMSFATWKVTAGTLTKTITALEVEVQSYNRHLPAIVVLPFVRSGDIIYPKNTAASTLKSKFG